MSTVQLKILDQRLADHLPAYTTPGSAAVDLRAAIDEPLVIEPGKVHLISTGISIFVGNPGLASMILPRSGLGHKNGLILGNGVGLIDSDYQGPLMVSLWNRSAVPFTLNPLDRFAQLVFVPVVQVGFEIVTEFDTTERGADGFGSSGTN